MPPPITDISLGLTRQLYSNEANSVQVYHSAIQQRHSPDIRTTPRSLPATTHDYAASDLNALCTF